MKLLREPLFHFLVLGAGLFVLFGLVDDSEGTRTDRIVVTTGQIQRLAEGWTRTWQRPPTRQELDGLVEDFIREEVFYREALAMGLDRDDLIVRRRLRQKVEFLTDDLVAAVEPTEEELRGYPRQKRGAVSSRFQLLLRPCVLQPRSPGRCCVP